MSCCICFEETKEIETNCGYHFHLQCYNMFIKTSNSCPICRREINSIKTDIEICYHCNDIIMNDIKVSTCSSLHKYHINCYNKTTKCNECKELNGNIDEDFPEIDFFTSYKYRIKDHARHMNQEKQEQIIHNSKMKFLPKSRRK